MYLSYQQIETIASTMLADFYRKIGKEPICTPIEQFATDYLGLTVSYAKLCPNRTLGLTAYGDTIYSYVDKGSVRELQIRAGHIYLDKSLAENSKKVCGCRRFTLAHECAHQVLFGLEVDSDKTKHVQMYAARQVYSLRELKSKEDWNEWQANALGAAFVMSASKVVEQTDRLTRGKGLTSYEGWFNLPDKLVIARLCNAFGVSKTAMAIRLERLNLCEKKPRSEFFDPTEVLA